MKKVTVAQPSLFSETATKNTGYEQRSKARCVYHINTQLGGTRTMYILASILFDFSML